MQLKDLPGWPPPWQPLLLRTLHHIFGEIGVLKSVTPLYADGHLAIKMELAGVEYIGTLNTDPSIRDQLIAFLLEQKDRSIEEIGRLEILTEL